MIANLIGGFVAILIGTSLIGPVSQQTSIAASSTNRTGGTCTWAVDSASTDRCQLYLSSTWGATVLKLVPGFFALGIMGIGVAVTYSSLRQAGIV
jgi:hypothetical protein